VVVGAAIDFTAVFTDPGFSSGHTATWSWGDNNTTSLSGISSPFSAGHVYATAGLYTVSLVLTSPSGLSAEVIYEFVVVYDPSGGFVTGGGWIDSPSGAYVDDSSLTGQATFGFVSKFTRGRTTPTGNTQFKFKAASFDFSSDHYDWLVVAGADNAIFSGSGTINGQLDASSKPYKFTVWAQDDPDTFRIRIWWEGDDAVEHVIYDNGFDQEIGGGSIVVHRGKGK
jgi:PKD repeat protein